MLWLNSGDHITDLRVTGVLPEKPQWSGQPNGTRVVNVGVRFNLDQTLWSSFVDPSMEEGLTVWGYLLKQNHDSGRWVIFDGGVA